MSRPATSGISCEVCNIQREPGEIHARQSKLIKGAKLLICKKCEAEKKEPRGFVIIVARTQGYDAVTDYIKNYRYVGKPIEAREIMK